ncbi:hypothetical protein ACFL17_06905 [Pseudomonadota bacterium]
MVLAFVVGFGFFLAVYIAYLPLTEYQSGPSRVLTETPSGYYTLAYRLIFWQEKEIYDLNRKDKYWRFSRMSSAYVYDGGEHIKCTTIGIPSDTRVVPGGCSGGINSIVWKFIGNENHFFLLRDGPGGSAANINYKLLAFKDGYFLYETEPFFSGEYFGIKYEDGYVILYNEHTPSERVKVPVTANNNGKS